MGQRRLFTAKSIAQITRTVRLLDCSSPQLSATIGDAAVLGAWTMKARSRRVNASIGALSLLSSLAAVGSSALASDPFASNNGLYPSASAWQGPFRSLSYNYPSGADNGWRRVAPREPLSITNAGSVRPYAEGIS